MARICIIGDVGGHVDELTRALTGLGVDCKQGSIPVDLTIVSVGDLIHRGPDSAAVVTLVDRFRRTSPTQWVQLAGNHEAQYFRTPVFTWNENLPQHTRDTIKKWWTSGWMQLAWSTRTDGVIVRQKGGERVAVGAGDLLVTHAGLTAGRWHRLGEPETAAEAAEAINTDARARRDDDWSGVWAPGVMLTRSPDVSAGVIWAASDSEVLRSWAKTATGADLPAFHQAHGHSRPAYRSSNGATGWSAVVRMLDPETHTRHFDQDTRISRVEIHQPGHARGMVIWGTDPGHGTDPAPTWEPLLLTASEPV